MALTDHFVDPFVRKSLREAMTLLWRYNVQMCYADAILYGDTCLENRYLYVLVVFSERFWLLSGKTVQEYLHIVYTTKCT